MPEIYKKIEKRIVELKEKEELWKGRYREIAQQVKELVDANSRQMKDMQDSIKNFEGRVQKAEAHARRAEERSEELLRLTDRRISEFSASAKGLSERLEEKGEQIKKIKDEVTSLVNGMITRHEKTFDSVLEKIYLATGRIENELQKGEDLYGKMEAAKRFSESYTPPNPSKLEPLPVRANDLPDSFSRIQQPIPQAPRPERSEPPFIYEAASPPSIMRVAPRNTARNRIDVDDLDDDMEVDDMISGNMKGFKDSVESMNSSVSSIAKKLASIEEKVAEMQTGENPSLERLDDKIRMYSESVTDMHSRMETVEKALRDGMTPMMESLKLLTDSVKSLKEESRARPTVKKPEPPARPSPSEPVLVTTPSNRVPPSFQRIHAKKLTKPPSGSGVTYG